MNTTIDGVPVRIYSPAKTIADCLKYRKKIGRNFATKILAEGITSKKFSEQRLRDFAKICRVGKIVHAAFASNYKVASKSTGDLARFLILL